MLLARFRNLLLTCSILMTGSAFVYAQTPHTAPKWQPFGPVDMSDEHDYRPFKAADLSEYGNGPKLNEGWFLQYDRLIWAFNSPNKIQIGDTASQGVINNDNVAPFHTLDIPPLDFLNFNTLDTSFIQTEFVHGNRYELGYMQDKHGWLASAAYVHLHTQNISANFATIAFFDPFDVYKQWLDTNGDGTDEDFDGDNIYGNTQPDNEDLNGDHVPDIYAGPDFGDLVRTSQRFDSLFAENRTSFATIELMYLNRLDTFHNGSTLEMMYGVRFISVHDDYLLVGTGGSGSIQSFFINNDVNNYIIGPQLGMRYFRQTGRWNVGSQLRGMIAANFQQIDLDGAVINRESARSALFFSGQFNDSVSETQFSPVGELRFDVGYQVTDKIYLHGGYTATVVGGITRASERVEYVLPASNILNDNKRETFFANGVDFGIVFNR
jgi:hypothetical protein